jgi:hypothetical protein
MKSSTGERLQVRTAQWRLDQLDRAAALSGRTVSSIVREAVDEKLARMGIRSSGDDLALLLNVSVPLVGDEGQRFLAFETREFLTNHSEAGRKLLLKALALDESEQPLIRQPLARAPRGNHATMKALLTETLQELEEATG